MPAPRRYHPGMVIGQVTLMDKIGPRLWSGRCSCGKTKDISSSRIAKLATAVSCYCSRDAKKLYRDRFKRKGRCECGNRREAGRYACDRCEAMDGPAKTHGFYSVVWSELRMHTPCTTEFLLDVTGIAPENLYRRLSDLRSRGMAKSYTMEGDLYSGEDDEKNPGIPLRWWAIPSRGYTARLSKPQSGTPTKMVI